MYPQSCSNSAFPCQGHEVTCNREFDKSIAFFKSVKGRVVSYSPIHEPPFVIGDADFNRFSKKRVIYCFIPMFLHRKNLGNHGYAVTMDNLDESDKFFLQKCADKRGVLGC